MSRHRNVRSMNFEDEYYDEDDYSHSYDDSHCVSPGTVAQFTFNRDQNINLTSYMGEEEGIPEEEEEDISDNLQISKDYSRPTLSDLDEGKLNSCLEEVRNILGESVPESVMKEVVLRHQFNLEACLDELLKMQDAPKPQRQPRQNRRSGSQGSDELDNEDDLEIDCPHELACDKSERKVEIRKESEISGSKVFLPNKIKSDLDDLLKINGGRKSKCAQSAADVSINFTKCLDTNSGSSENLMEVSKGESFPPTISSFGNQNTPMVASGPKQCCNSSDNLLKDCLKDLDSISSLSLASLALKAGSDAHPVLETDEPKISGSSLAAIAQKKDTRLRGFHPSTTLLHNHSGMTVTPVHVVSEPRELTSLSFTEKRVNSADKRRPDLSLAELAKMHTVTLTDQKVCKIPATRQNEPVNEEKIKNISLSHLAGLHDESAKSFDLLHHSSQTGQLQPNISNLPFGNNRSLHSNLGNENIAKSSEMDRWGTNQHLVTSKLQLLHLVDEKNSTQRGQDIDYKGISLSELAKQHALNQTKLERKLESSLLELSTLCMESKKTPQQTGNYVQRGEYVGIDTIPTGFVKISPLTELQIDNKRGSSVSLSDMAKQHVLSGGSGSNLSLAQLAQQHKKNLGQNDGTKNIQSLSELVKKPTEHELGTLKPTLHFLVPVDKPVGKEVFVKCNNQTSAIHSSTSEDCKGHQMFDSIRIITEKLENTKQPSVLGKVLCFRVASEGHKHRRHSKLLYSVQMRGCKSVTPIRLKKIKPFDFSTLSPDDEVKEKQKAAFLRTEN